MWAGRHSWCPARIHQLQLVPASLRSILPAIPIALVLGSVCQQTFHAVFAANEKTEFGEVLSGLQPTATPAIRLGPWHSTAALIKPVDGFDGLTAFAPASRMSSPTDIRPTTSREYSSGHFGILPARLKPPSAVQVENVAPHAVSFWVTISRCQSARNRMYSKCQFSSVSLSYRLA